MNDYRFPENRAGKAAFAAILLVLMLLTRDAMYTMAVWGFYNCFFLSLGLIVVLGLVFVLWNRRNLKQIAADRRMIAVILSAALILIPMLVKRDWQLMYFSILLCLVFAVFLSYFVKFREVARYYVLILTALSVYSLLAMYVLRPLADLGVLSPGVVVNSTGRDFYDFGLAFVSITEVKNRNFGVFREPGVYQFFLLLALYLNNYTVTWKKTWQTWLINGILALTMLTTFSTGGVIELGLFAVVLFFDKKLYRDKRARWTASVLVIAVLAVLGVSAIQQNTLYRELYAMIIGKFVNRTVSFTERVDAIFTDLWMFLQHPLFGEKLAAVLHSVENNTTSTLILYAVLGVAGGTLNVAAWVAFVWEKQRKVWANLALLGIMFLSFNTENLITDIFFWLFPMMALVERGLPLLKLESFGKKRGSQAP